MQSSSAELEYASKKTVMRRDHFLTEIETVALRAEQAALEPFYPKGEETAYRDRCPRCVLSKENGE